MEYKLSKEDGLNIVIKLTTTLESLKKTFSFINKSLYVLNSVQTKKPIWMQ